MKSRRNKIPTLTDELGINFDKIRAEVKDNLTREEFETRLRQRLEGSTAGGQLTEPLLRALYEEAIDCRQKVVARATLGSRVTAQDLSQCLRMIAKLDKRFGDISEGVRKASEAKHALHKSPLAITVYFWTDNKVQLIRNELEEVTEKLERMKQLMMGRLEFESYLMLRVDRWLQRELAGTKLNRRREVLRSAFVAASRLMKGKDVNKAVAMRISRAKKSKTADVLDDVLFEF